MSSRWMVVTLLGVFLVAAGPGVEASQHAQKCHKKGGDYSSQKGHKSLEQKFYKKVHFLMQHQEEIGLSEEQIESVREIKHKLKKDIIARDAEVDTIKVDIYAKLYDKKVDVEGIKQLIDQKYEFKKSKAKAVVEAYAAVKDLLSEEQYETMKKVWRASK